jgi:hypothetical protein
MGLKYRVCELLVSLGFAPDAEALVCHDKLVDDGDVVPPAGVDFMKPFRLKFTDFI